MIVLPTSADFKELFDRGEFVYGDELPSVRDKDIERAMTEARALFNVNLISDGPTRDMAFLYLTAHFLQMDTDAAESGGGSVGVQTARAADGISESIAVPDWVTDPQLYIYASTYYGRKYLALLQPYMVGAVFVIGGGTLP